MDATEALKLIRPLADGIDPNTGEIFPKNSPYQNPGIIRALFTAVDVLEKESRHETRKKDGPKRSGEPWTEKEKTKLAEFFDSGISIRDIAEKHQRSPYAVALRLNNMGKIKESELAKYSPPEKKTNNGK